MSIREHKGTFICFAPLNDELEVDVRAFTAVIERCPDTGLYVGYVPGFPGAHSQGATLDELHRNLAEVIGMLLEDGEPQPHWRLI